MQTEPLRPLEGLKVVNFAAGLAAALSGKFLAEYGADVLRPAVDGGDPFGAVYPAYETLRRFEIFIAYPDSEAALDRLLGDADICIVGGEDHPQVTRGLAAKDLDGRYPRLIVFDIQGYPPGVADGRPAADLLIQACTGLVYENGAERPTLMSFHPSSYGAALHGLTGVMAALYRREQDGLGQRVTTSLFEGALVWAHTWGVAEFSTAAFDFRPPKNSTPLILPCADGVYIHVVLGSPGSKARLYEALAVPGPAPDPADSGLPDPDRGPGDQKGEFDLLASCAVARQSAELLAALAAADVPAALIRPVGACWSDPQVVHNQVITTAEDGRRHVGRPIGGWTLPTEAGSLPAPTDDRPLSGLRIVDFGAYIAGPAVSAMMATLGAEVIKVEPVTGDPMRKLWCFNAANGGKRMIALNVKTEIGREVARRLCAHADVVTSNFRGGAAARLGIDAETLHLRRPELVVLDSPGYGVGGPDADLPAFDPIIQAVSGQEVRSGGSGNPPHWDRNLPCDFAGASVGALAVAMAVYQRARTGSGANLEAPLLNSGIYLTSDIIGCPGGEWVGPMSLDARQTGFGPAEMLYQGADGWIGIVVRDENSARGVGQALELAGRLPEDWRRWTGQDAEMIAQACRGRAVADLVASLELKGVWVEICRASTERAILTDPEMNALGVVSRIAHPTLGTLRSVAPAFRFSRSGLSIDVPIPPLGAHTREVLEELRFSVTEIDAMFEHGTVR